MGLDAIFQAIPNDEELLERIRTNNDWEILIRNPIQCRSLNSPLRRMAMERKDGTDLIRDFDIFFDTWIDVLALKLNWGRRWDMLTYLLVPSRRTYTLHDAHSLDGSEYLSGLTERENLIYCAIMGGRLLLKSDKTSRATQMETLRYVSSQDVKEISTIFDEMTFADVLAHYSDDAMSKALVYKFHPYQKGTQEDIVEAFVILRDFYMNVSYRRAGVLHYLI